MKFGQLRHRIILMKRKGTIRNSMNEEVTTFEVYHPGLKLLVVLEDGDEQGNIYLKTQGEGNAEIAKDRSGGEYAHFLTQSEYAYWADVRPTTGREYEEMQKIRAETTYNVNMRFLPGITHDMYILFGDKKLNIESILDIDERHKELTLVCSEVLR